MLEKIVDTASRINGSVNKLYNTKASEIFNEGGFMDSIMITLGIGINANLMYNYVKGSIVFIRDVASQISRFY